MTDDVLDRFSPATATWFRNSFAEPTQAQVGAWSAISAGSHALVVAPTGSGKTLSAFLWALDRLASTPPPEERLARCLAEGFIYQGEGSPNHDGAPRGEPSAHLRPTAFVSFLQNHDQVGNRAAGDRIHHGISPGAHAAAIALILLGPGTPMLFQGEEWAASTPWPFFTAHPEPELADAVRSALSAAVSAGTHSGYSASGPEMTASVAPR